MEDFLADYVAEEADGVIAVLSDDEPAGGDAAPADPARIFNAPRARSKIEHMALCSRMREARQKRRSCSATERIVNVTKVVTSKDSGTVRRAALALTSGRKRAKQANNRNSARAARRCLLRVAMPTLKRRKRREEIAATDVEVAFDGGLRATDVGLRAGVSRKSVSMSRQLVARGTMVRQLELLSLWHDRAVDSKDRFLSASLGIGFDESKFKVRLPVELGDGLSLSTSAPWHSVVSMRRLVLTFRGSSPVELAIVSPLIPTQDTSSGSLLRAMFEVEAVAPIMQLIWKILSLSSFSFEVWAVDGASGNDALYNFKLLADDRGKRIEDPLTHGRSKMKVLCMSHRNHLTENYLKDSLDYFFNGMRQRHVLEHGGPILRAKEVMVSRIFSLCAYVRMGSFVIRLFATVVPVLEKRVTFVIGEQPAAYKAFALEWKRYMLSQWNQFKYIGSESEEDGRKRRQSYYAYSDAWDRMLKLWSCDWTSRDEIVVYTDELVDAKKQVRLMAQAFTSAVFRNTVSSPQHGKWTKYAPAADWVTSISCVCDMLRWMMKEAGSPMTSEMKTGKRKRKGAKEDGDAAKMDQAELEQVSWHKVAGARYNSALTFLELDRVNVALSAQIVCLEPIRALTKWFLRASSDAPREELMLWKLLRDSESPVVEQLQYLRFLGSGCAPRMGLVFGAGGAETMAEYMALHAAESEEVLLLPRVVSAVTYRRLEVARTTWPLKAAVLGDAEAAADEKVQLCREMKAMTPCCLGPFWGRFLRHVLRPEDIISEDMQAVLGGLALTLDKTMSIASLERQNKQTKTVTTDPGMSWEHVSAATMNKNTKAHFEHAMAALNKDTRDKNNHMVVPASAASTVAKPKRGRSALEIFLKEQNDRMRALGVQCNVENFTRGFKRDLKSRFLALSPEEQENYEYQSKSEKADAKAARRQWAQTLGAAADDGEACRPVSRPAVPLPGLVGLHAPPGDPVAIDDVGPAAAAGPGDGLHMVPFRPIEAVQRLSHLIEAVRPNTMLEAKPGECNGLEMVPFTPVHAETHEATMKQEGASREVVCDVYRKQCTQVASDTGAVPKSQRYLRSCHGICCRAPLKLRKLERRILDYALALVSNNATKPKDIGFKFVFFECELVVDFAGEKHRTSHTFSIDAAWGRAGATEASQIFTAHGQLHLEDLRVIKPLERPWVERKKQTRKEITMGSVGAYDQLDERQLAERVLQPLVGLTRAALEARNASLKFTRLLTRNLMWPLEGEDLPESYDYRVVVEALGHQAVTATLHDKADADGSLEAIADADDTDFFEGAAAASGVDFTEGTLEEWLSELIEEGVHDDEAREESDSNDEADKAAVDAFKEIVEESEDEAEVELEEPASPYTSYLAELGLVEGPEHSLLRVADGLKVGTLRWVWMAQPMIHAVCATHPGCQAFVSTASRYEDRWRGIMRWLRDGHGIAKAEHQDQLRDYKARVGIHIRGAKPAAGKSTW